jgi:PAS domain S-box-containing protein
MELGDFSAFESVPDALLVVGRDGSILFANQHAERLFGYEPGKLVGTGIEALIPERFHQLHVEKRAEFSADPTVRPMGYGRELFARKSDGQEIQVEVGLGPTDGGECVVAVVRDITSLAKIRRSLAITEAEVDHLSQTFGNMPIGLCYFDKELRFLRISNWLAKINGISVGEHLGRKIGEVIPDVAVEVEPKLRQVLQTGEPIINGLVKATTPAHPTTIRTYMHNYSPQRSDDGSVVGVLCVVQDVTEATENLETALAEIGQLKDRLQAEAEYLREDIKRERRFDEIIGKSAAMVATLEKVEQAAKTDATVLLLGETGTGKELLARALHARSNRAKSPLIKIDCATLPSGLVESELFGHEKGAFTGAHDTKPGRFELADNGTIFLDEIGELSLELQAKLLRVLQEGEFKRLGAKHEQKVDVRIIAATNRDLKQEMREQRFRSDLYYRLSVFPIEIPPLRDRREDIPLLAAYFLSRFQTTLGKKIDAIEKSSLDALVAYDWPGNIRELQNIIERSAILCSGTTLTVQEALGDFEFGDHETAKSMKQDLAEVERSSILHALEESAWKVKGEGNAADRLGINASTLRSRMKKLGISRR